MNFLNFPSISVKFIIAIGKETNCYELQWNGFHFYIRINSKPFSKHWICTANLFCFCRYSSLIYQMGVRFYNKKTFKRYIGGYHVTVANLFLLYYAFDGITKEHFLRSEVKFLIILPLPWWRDALKVMLHWHNCPLLPSV